jgi:hypothetical protein
MKDEINSASDIATIRNTTEDLRHICTARKTKNPAQKSPN